MAPGLRCLEGQLPRCLQKVLRGFCGALRVEYPASLGCLLVQGIPWVGCDLWALQFLAVVPLVLLK